MKRSLLNRVIKGEVKKLYEVYLHLQPKSTDKYDLIIKESTEIKIVMCNYPSTVVSHVLVKFGKGSDSIDRIYPGEPIRLYDFYASIDEGLMDQFDNRSRQIKRLEKQLDIISGEMKRRKE